MELCRKIFPDNCPVFYDSSEFKRKSKSTQSLVDICLTRGATHYLTGHGAKNYLDFELFSKNNIQVEFIDYQIKEYIQINNKYITPYVSSLDAIARLELDQVKDLFLSNLIRSEVFMKLQK